MFAHPSPVVDYINIVDKHILVRVFNGPLKSSSDLSSIEKNTDLLEIDF